MNTKSYYQSPRLFLTPLGMQRVLCSSVDALEEVNDWPSIFNEE